MALHVHGPAYPWINPPLPEQQHILPGEKRNQPKPPVLPPLEPRLDLPPHGPSRFVPFPEPHNPFPGSNPSLPPHRQNPNLPGLPILPNHKTDNGGCF
jgi:hypothetical protein